MLMKVTLWKNADSERLSENLPLWCVYGFVRETVPRTCRKAQKENHWHVTQRRVCENNLWLTFSYLLHFQVFKWAENISEIKISTFREGKTETQWNIYFGNMGVISRVSPAQHDRENFWREKNPCGPQNWSSDPWAASSNVRILLNAGGSTGGRFWKHGPLGLFKGARGFRGRAWSTGAMTLLTFVR